MELRKKQEKLENTLRRKGTRQGYRAKWGVTISYVLLAGPALGPGLSCFGSM